jgi:hypothetical protein
VTTMGAVRLDQRFRRPARSVVAIAEEVFGAPAGTGGPRWLLDPPPATVELFWDRFGPGIGDRCDVFAACGRVLLEEVRDAHDRPLPSLAGRSGEASLFFVDCLPEANWSHPCAYVVLPATGGEPLRVEHDWPPSEAHRLAPLRRPSSRQ